jgi:hypothetical protein
VKLFLLGACVLGESSHCVFIFHVGFCELIQVILQQVTVEVDIIGIVLHVFGVGYWGLVSGGGKMAYRIFHGSRFFSRPA